MKQEERRLQEKAAERARHLDALTGREEELWQQIESAVGTKLPKDYIRAVDLVRDLSDLAERSGSREALAQRIRKLRGRHGAKRKFIQLLNQAGFPA